MSPDRWFVTIPGVLPCIAFIVWFFWLKRRKGVRAAEEAAIRRS